MVCPLINNDDSRQCMEKFGKLVPDVLHSFCKLEEFNICPFYQIIVNKKPYCECIQDCGYHFHRLNSIIHHNTEKYKEIMHLIFDFCLSDKMEDCARLKFIKNNKIPPNVLLQDGSNLKTQDILPEKY